MTELFPGNLTESQNKARMFIEIQKYPAPKNVVFTMCDIQSKFSRYIKKQNRTHDGLKINQLKNNDNKSYHWITYSKS